MHAVVTLRVRYLTQEIETEVDQGNISDTLFKLMYNNVRPCLTHVDLDEQIFDIDNGTSYFFLHLNIASVQAAHFDELNVFINNFINPPAIIFLSKTRINFNPQISIDIPVIPLFILLPIYKQIHLRSNLSTSLQ